MAVDDDQEFQNAAFKPPGEEPGYNRWGVAEIQVKENSPWEPEGAPKEQEPKDHERILIVQKGSGDNLEEIDDFVAAHGDAQ